MRKIVIDDQCSGGMKRLAGATVGLAVFALACISPLASSGAADAAADAGVASTDGGTLPPLSVRFADENASETPDFQRHIGPLLGHLGCNGRACHGSFQGRGGFALSLFGYDFTADHKAMTDADSGRVNLDDVHESLLLYKPIDEERHEGGKRMDIDSWQYRVLARWISQGAKYDKKIQSLQRLEVTPAEIVFDGSGDGKTEQLKAIAVWADGSREDVTDLCRFTTNDDVVASIAADGLVTSKDVGDTHVVVAYDRAVVPVAVIRPSVVDSSQVARPAESRHMIDRLVKQKLDKLGIIPSGLCSDSDYIRRASLDLTGMLPTADRVEKFLADPSPTKRSDLIDELLSNPAYAGWWATRFSDWTGNNESMLNNYLPVRGMASKMWFSWLQKRFADNVPYDKIVEGIVTAESRLPDESYREYCETMSEICRTGNTEPFADRPGLPTFWARSNFRATEDRAVGFAYSFLGVRIQCAQCHKHPFDQWSKDDFDQFAKLFAPIRANQNNVARDAQDEMRKMIATITDGKKLNGGELRNAMTQAVTSGKIVPFPELTVQPIAPPRPDRNARDRDRTPPAPTGRILGESDKFVIKGDPRESLMAWLRSPNNPYFAKAIVNRVWANYFGIGIVNPVDDLNLGNPPSNAALLAYLADGFVDSGYDLHWLHREIMTSDAYQRSSEANVTNAGDKRNFSRHVPRRLPAEVLRDSLYLVTASEKAESAARSELQGLAISGNMNPGRRGRGDFALQIFGQSTRESNCDCDRSEQANLLQAIYLQNDIDIHQALRQNGGWISQVTAAWPKPKTEGDNQRTAALAAAEQRGRVALEQRVEQMLKLPESRQDQVRQRLKRELDQHNKKRVEFGYEPLKLSDLIRSVSAKDTKDDIQKTADDQAAPVTKRLTVASDEIEAAIRSAYMRTLCRQPDQDEMSVGLAFVQESDDPVAGFRSVVWALMNTKEFVLTH
jgi:hypothetical protein